MKDCPFCTIAQSDPRGQIEQIIGASFVITPLNPVIPGHKLVIPMEHVTDVADVPFVTGRTFEAAAMYIERNLPNADVNVITSRGKHATQTVFHLHIHIVPRIEGDDLKLPWSE